MTANSHRLQYYRSFNVDNSMNRLRTTHIKKSHSNHVHQYGCRLFLFLLAIILTSSCGIDRNIKKGEKFLSIGEYYDAAAQFKTAYQRTPAKNREQRGQLAKKMAYCYDRINSSQRAIAAYKNVVRYKQDDYQTHLKLAENLMKNGSYGEALKEYRLVLDSMPDNGLAAEGVSAATVAPTIKEQGSYYKVKKMTIFNSRRQDYSPMIYGDQHNQLYFTSTRNDAKGDEISGITV